MSEPVLRIELLHHRGADWLGLYFQPLPALLALARQAGATYTNTHKCWYLKNTPANFRAVIRLFREKGYVDFSSIVGPQAPTFSQVIAPERTTVRIKRQTKASSEALQPLGETGKLALEKFEMWLKSKRYSSNTVKTYTEALRTFLRFMRPKVLSEMTNDDLIRFNNEYILAGGYSASFQNQMVNAIKLAVKVLGAQRLDPELIHRPRAAKVLPNVLSKEEVKKLLAVPLNVKHRAMLSMVYACGLRRSELLNLKISHVDSERSMLLIKQAKGKKIGWCLCQGKCLILFTTIGNNTAPSIGYSKGRIPARNTARRV